MLLIVFIFDKRNSHDFANKKNFSRQKTKNFWLKSRWFQRVVAFKRIKKNCENEKNNIKCWIFDKLIWREEFFRRNYVMTWQLLRFN